jgi:hypothetical protein
MRVVALKDVIGDENLRLAGVIYARSGRNAHQGLRS